MAPSTFITLAELATQRAAWGEEGARVALVPTMGALHLGHLSLVRLARQMADRVVVSIFVNPTQFGPNEDFAKYPRTLVADLELLASLQVEAVFLPNAATMYPDGFQTFVHNQGMALTLDGQSRPGHFQGVLTVVMKLLNLVRPDVAIFGKKDYQQWRLIEKMVADLCLPYRIAAGETLREVDGLAMSSRNRFLDDQERSNATAIYRGLSAAKAAYKSGERDAQKLTLVCRKLIEISQLVKIDYVELRSAATLVPLSGQVTEPCVLLVAAKLGTTRLIDNMEME
jgi:pantoate--beta-alanine ligase